MGAPPQTGIDLEPNHENEVLSHIVIGIIYVQNERTSNMKGKTLP